MQGGFSTALGVGAALPWPRGSLRGLLQLWKLLSTLVSAPPTPGVLGSGGPAPCCRPEGPVPMHSGDQQGAERLTGFRGAGGVLRGPNMAIHMSQL